LKYYLTKKRPVLFQTTLEPTSSPTPSPTVTLATPSPTSNPTLSPSFPCNLSPEDRAQAFRNIALTVTDAATLDDPSSAQAQALDWIINEDFVDSPCPEDGPCETVQRYIMAAFYFAADGGNWDQCNAANDLSSPESVAIADSQCNRVVTPFPVNNPRIGDTSTASWLSPVDECEWGGLACWGTDDTRRGCMDQIDFGETSEMFVFILHCQYRLIKTDYFANVLSTQRTMGLQERSFLK